MPNNSKHKILFILKRKENPYEEIYENPNAPDPDDQNKSGNGMNTGLLTSATFVQEMLANNGIESKIVVVTDNNDIDREVTVYKPTDVIIEALWVVPSKFDVLISLHPTVKWVVRLHSDIPFIANEGIAMGWILDYVTKGMVSVSCNDIRMFNELTSLFISVHSFTPAELAVRLLYQPNYYPQNYLTQSFLLSNRIDIGCFGAIRPMKNQLTQAVAAIKFAENNGRFLNFHINSDRIEMKGSPVLHNLLDLFDRVRPLGHRLIQHPWTDHTTFKNLCGQMDIGMQVSFSETFDIIAADHVSMGVPILTSAEVPWSNSTWQADPTDIDDMVNKMQRIAFIPRINVFFNTRGLDKFSKNSKKVWLKQYK